MSTITRPLLAGAYAGRGRSNPRTMLTHAIVVDAGGHWISVLCTRVKIEHLCDHSDEPDETPPTCPRCVAALARRARELG